MDKMAFKKKKTEQNIWDASYMWVSSFQQY